ncbi:hypothetical protein [Ileibacterium valens]|uniref:hypothetical protein n=1 Tax=Ileibacterium valens TaxID=1862668 RepID=UPI00259BAADE|nr:hypothetical protein [Ileibacterium valens]
MNECRIKRKIYTAGDAHDSYEYTLKDSREVINLTHSQAKALGDILKEGTDRGLSLYTFMKAHPEIKQSERTLCNYIEQGVFSCSDLINIDLPAKTKRKYKKAPKMKVRQDRAYLKNRTYADFEAFIRAHHNLPVVEMDTCYNDVSEGPFIQTFQFVEYGLMVGIYQTEKTAQAMYLGV